MGNDATRPFRRDGDGDMKNRLSIGLLAVMLTGVGAAPGASVPGSLSSDYPHTPSWMARVTIGVGGEQIGRTISPDEGPNVSLDILAFGGFVGYAATPYLTVFGSVGGTDNQADDSDDSGSGFKVSAGVNYNVARYNIRQPSFLNNDRVTVRALAEVAYYDVDTLEWWQGTLALPIAYEIVENDRVANVREDERMVLALYVGPQLSVMRGRLDTPGGRTDFDADRAFGLLAGADLYLNPYASIGMHVSFFDSDDDELTGGASFRYRF